jgi:sulfide dehydrogenase [flavocytochrome c] flavoprotein subunit
MSGLTRRAFLGWASSAGLLGLTGCSGKKIRHAKSNPNARVVVLGGGFGGATAAKYLRLFDPLVKITLIERNNVYLSCPGSNEVIASLKRPRELRHDYKALVGNHGIELTTGEATGMDIRQRTVTLADGSRVNYDRLIVAPGIDFRWDAIEGYDEEASQIVPHAWKAGPQMTLLRRQVRGMRNGGVVTIVVPDNPYRCPPGPYERASLIAYFLSQYKPRSKVVILDSKTAFSKQAAFQQGWKELYPGMIEWISSEKQGRIERVEPERRTVHTEFGKHRADVLNVIPPQKAGRLAEIAGLTDASGWCPVNPQTFESTLAPGVHVIGDACIATPMPKSAFAANSQAKVCAAAVLDLLADVEPEPPSLINNCYSFLDPDNAISISGVYGYSSREKGLTALSSGETQPGANRRREAELARSWYEVFMQQVFT